MQRSSLRLLSFVCSVATLCLPTLAAIYNTPEAGRKFMIPLYIASLIFGIGAMVCLYLLSAQDRKDKESSYDPIKELKASEHRRQFEQAQKIIDAGLAQMEDVSVRDVEVTTKDGKKKKVKEFAIRIRPASVK